MNIWFRVILQCNMLMMRFAMKMAKKESSKENEFCWLENAITDLDKLVKEKL